MDEPKMVRADRDGWHFDPPQPCGGVAEVDRHGRIVKRYACEVHLMPWGHLPPGGVQ